MLFDGKHGTTAVCSVPWFSMESIVQKSSILGDEGDAFVRWRHGNGDGACVNEMLRTDCAHTYQIFVVNARAAARKNTTPFHECLAMSGYRHGGSCHGRHGTRVNVHIWKQYSISCFPDKSMVQRSVQVNRSSV